MLCPGGLMNIVEHAGRQEVDKLHDFAVAKVGITCPPLHYALKGMETSRRSGSDCLKPDGASFQASEVLRPMILGSQEQ